MAEQKKSRKHGRARNSGQNLAYKAEHRHEKSHVRRIKKHLLRYGDDAAAAAAMMRIVEKIGLKAYNSAKEFLAERKRAA